MTDLPVHLRAVPEAAWIFMAVAAIFFLVSLAWAAWTSWRERHALALMSLAGGGIAALEEGWIDRLIQLWYPIDSPWVVFTALGIPQPLYVFLVYPGFIGLGAFVCYRGLLKHPDGRLLWPSFCIIVLMDVAFEVAATANGVFYYYGRQPFQLVVDGWPAWVAGINATGPVLGGWMLFKLEPWLRGARRPLLVLVPPLAYAGTYGATCWPTTTMLNSNVADLWLQAASLATIALSILIVAILKSTLTGIAMPQPSAATVRARMPGLPNR